MSKREKTFTISALDIVIKTRHTWGQVEGRHMVHKPRKGKGSYSRKGKPDRDY